MLGSLRNYSEISALAFVALVAGTALTACGGGDDGGAPKDASDTVDTPPVSVCGADTPFTGETIDFDSNGVADGFCGVFGTTVTVRAATKVTTATTAPNGRFVGICVPAQGALIDITPPTEASQCASQPGSYPKAGILIVDPAVIAAGGKPSVRMLSSVALARMYTMAGPVGGDYNPDQTNVVFHFTGTPQKVTTESNSFSKVQQFNGTQWETVTDQTAPGSDVLFPNLDASTPIKFTIAGGTPNSVTLTPGATLVADKFTYVTIVTP
jgi:hypothetical protein